jgi:hypothetical protein
VVEAVDADGNATIDIGTSLRVDFRRVDDDLTLPIWRTA